MNCINLQASIVLLQKLELKELVPEPEKLAKPFDQDRSVVEEELSKELVLAHLQLLR